MSSQPHRSVPGLEAERAGEVVSILEDRLVALIDLHLVLKHIHWNVVGPNFLSVHEMLDEQVEPARLMTDDVAERIRTLGGEPNGNSGHVASARTWDDYPLGRASVFLHLKALDDVYDGVIADHRKAMQRTGDLDPVTEDMLIGQIAKLELAQWFVRSFVERAGESDGQTEPNSATKAAERRNADKAHETGRGPTDREAATADRNAERVDNGAVSESYREMTSTGANVKGEGRIG